MNTHDQPLLDPGFHPLFRMRCWGDFALNAPDGADVTPRSRKSRALLAWLAYHPDHAISRERLAALLWGDRAEAQARASLRQALYELRGLATGEWPLLLIGPSHVTLCGDRLVGDTEALPGTDMSADPSVPLLAGFDDLGETFDAWLRYVRSRDTPARSARRTDARAVALYTEGRRLSGLPATRARSLACFEAAIAIQPDYGACWSALGLERAHAARWDARSAPFIVLADEVRATVARATRLDPASGLHHVALTLLRPHAHYAERERGLEHAALLSPDDPEVIRHCADFAYTVGRTQESFRRILVAQHIDPANQMMTQNYANMLYEMGHLKESQDIHTLARQRWPNLRWPISDPLLNAAYVGDWDCVDRLMPLAIAYPGADMDIARQTIPALRVPTRADFDAARVMAAENLRANGYVNVSTLLFTHRLGLCDETFDWIERSDYSHVFAVDGRGADSTSFRPGILFGVANRRMRDDSRFVGLCAKIGLTRYWRDTERWPDCAGALQARYGFIDLAKQQLGPALLMPTIPDGNF